VLRLLTDFLISIAELAEAEAQSLRQGLTRLLLSVALVAGCLVFMVTGLAMILWCVYMALASSQVFGPGGAAFATGAASLVVAAVLAHLSGAWKR
jgi:hypothetical protein